MKWRVAVSAAVLCGALCWAHGAWSATDTCFSPWQDCEEKWIEVIDSAKKEITVSCFGITNKMIAAALLDKHMQGVKVLVLEDRLQSKGKTDLGGYLASRGVEVVVKKKSALEHNKMVVVDREKVIIGSWNLSGNANGQDNSMIITTDEAVVASALEAMGRIYARDALPDGWPSNMRRDK